MPYVVDAVECVRAQDAALEPLFVNVDSSDGSLLQVSSIDDDRIRVIEAPAGTAPGPARNLAVRQALGDVLAFADADDLWRPDKLERQLRLMSATGAALV
jgi:glycosyltransferase involved in cell wall biosynthesis